MLRIMLNTLFTKAERILIKNNKEFVLTLSSDVDPSESIAYRGQHNDPRMGNMDDSLGKHF